MATHKIPSSQRDPLRPLSQASSRSGRRSVQYRQATLAECLDAYHSSQSSIPSSDDAEAPSSSVRSAKRIRLQDNSSSPGPTTSPPTSPASHLFKASPRPKRLPSRCLATHIDLLSLDGRRRTPTCPDARGYLRTLVSHNNDDLRCFAPTRGETLVPYTLVSSNAARRGESGGIVAVGANAGDISLFDPYASASPFGGKSHALRPNILAHANAIFTLAFSPSDDLLVTGSGDFFAGVFTTHNHDCIGVLGGHSGSIRSVSFAPDHEKKVVTGSRDGSVAVWDVRTDLTGPGTHIFHEGAPSIFVPNAHDDVYAHRPGPRPAGASKPSIAGASILPSNPCHLVSAASGDGVVKLWDLRKTREFVKIHPACKERSGNVGVLGGQDEEGHKGRGVSKMVVSSTGDRVYTLGMDSVIRTYDPQCLGRPSSLYPTFTSPSLAASSFYVPLALSPCDRFIACGSTDGNVYIWDVLAPSGSEPVVVKGHRGEIAGVDWTDRGIVTAGADLSIRRWTFDRGVAEEIKCADEEGERQQWSGVHSV